MTNDQVPVASDRLRVASTELRVAGYELPAPDAGNHKSQTANPKSSCEWPFVKGRREAEDGGSKMEERRPLAEGGQAKSDGRS